jgi:hypothetical protein
MKFIINESKIELVIEKFLNDTFDVENINWTPIMDFDGNEDDSAFEFYYGDFMDSDTVFRLYNKNYWRKMTDTRIPLSPILFFENNDNYKLLNDVFGDVWKPVFIKWFEKNFGFKVKTLRK